MDQLTGQVHIFWISRLVSGQVEIQLSGSADWTFRNNLDQLTGPVEMIWIS